MSNSNSLKRRTTSTTKTTSEAGAYPAYKHSISSVEDDREDSDDSKNKSDSTSFFTRFIRYKKSNKMTISSKANGNQQQQKQTKRPFFRTLSKGTWSLSQRNVALEHHDDDEQQFLVGGKEQPPLRQQLDDEHNDTYNYALLIALYTLQGIPMGLSASIPFLIQQKVKLLSSTAAAATAAANSATAGAAGGIGTTAAANAAAHAAKLSYNANAIFALCSWPFSLKLLWAPIVDACFSKKFGRRKTWLVPVQTMAGLIMIGGANFVQQQIGLGDEELAILKNAATRAAAASLVDNKDNSDTSDNAHRMLLETAAGAVAGSAATESGQMINVKGLTAFFFALYFLMATQDIAVDGWALTMLSKKNRGRGPVCNSIGQNIGYFISFAGFLALNDPEASESLWRPLLGLQSRPGVGLISLGGFVRSMGYFMLLTTSIVAFFKRENPLPGTTTSASTTTLTTATASLFGNDSISPFGNGSAIDRVSSGGGLPNVCSEVLDPTVHSHKTHEKHIHDIDEDDDKELDASEIGLKETYHRLWAVCQLPAVRWLFLVLLTYRLPTALTDNVKFLKAVEYGLSKSTTALLSPTLILPLGIAVPIVATKIWHGHPLRQFMTAYKFRVTVVPLLDLLMLHVIKQQRRAGVSTNSLSKRLIFWATIIASTGLQAIVNSLQFNAQMTFFANRVDPAIGGSYMTLLNTAANLGGTWPSSLILYLLGQFTNDHNNNGGSPDPDCLMRQQAQQEQQRILQQQQASSSLQPKKNLFKRKLKIENDAPIICPVMNNNMPGILNDPYLAFQVVLSGLGCLWILFLGNRVQRLAQLPDDAWRTHLLENDNEDSIDLELSPSKKRIGNNAMKDEKDK